jgi:hypothetical protein
MRYLKLFTFTFIGVWVMAVLSVAALLAVMTEVNIWELNYIDTAFRLTPFVTVITIFIVISKENLRINK